MKKFFAITLILTFAALAVFTVYAMNHEACFAHGGCIIEAVQNNLTVNREEKTSLVLLIAAVMIFLAGAALNSSPKIKRLFLYFSRWVFSEFIYLEKILTRWLAMRENSPSVI